MAQWLIWLGGEVIHQPVTTERNVIAAKLSLALDSAGSLEVDVPVSHPLYSTVAALPLLGRATWRVERDGIEVFRGRTLARERRPLDGSVRVTVEGDLAMLNDSIRTPYQFNGSPAAYVRMLVDAHNAQSDPWKQFSVGVVDIVDKGGNDYIVRGSESTVGTLEELLAKTVNSSDAGHIVLRRGTHVIDWLAVVSEPCDQPVRLGWNLLGMEDVSDGAELVTAIRAVGADVDGTRLTIADTRTGGAGVTVRDGILVNDALAATNGTVIREVVWDDVTQEDNLWSRALAYAQGLSEPRSVTVSAIDMSDAGHAVDSFDVGQMVALDALDTHGTMQVTGIEWDLLDPAGGSITFGDVRVTSSARGAAATATADAALYVAGSGVSPTLGRATFSGTDTTTTATANNWKVASFDTVVASAGTPSESFTFAAGVITAKRACKLAITGVMSWRDNISGLRGFGVCEGGTITGGSMTGTEHSVFVGYNTTTGNYFRAVTFPPKLFALAEGGTLTIGHSEPTNSVYYNGGGRTWLTIEVVG